MWLCYRDWSDLTMTDKKERKKRKDAGKMVVERQVKSLLPYFYASTLKSNTDRQLAEKQIIGTAKEIAESANMSYATYKRLCAKIREAETEDEKLDILENNLTIKGLKGLVKLVNLSKTDVVRERQRKRRALSARERSKAESDLAKKTLYEGKLAEMDKEWGEW